MAVRGVPVHAGRGSGRAHLLGATGLPQVPRGSVLIAVGLQDLPERLVVPEVSAIVLTRVEDRGPAGDVPAVAGVDIDLFREGDLVEVDGTAGDVVLPGVRETHVVTAFVARDDGRILLLRRSEKVGSFQGHWAAVSGYLEDPTPRQQALREVHEETGLSPDDVSVEREGVPVYARGGDQIFVVHPFLLRTRREEVRIDWEHTEFEWVTPAEIGRRPTVPKLDRAWTAVAPRPPGRRKG